MLDSDRILMVARWVWQSKSVVAFTGAGISTASGIPDFRSPESGLWGSVDPMKVASIFGFRHNPEAFYKWVEPLARKTLLAQPNAAHLALARLEQTGKLQAVITQNIDILHTRAGNSTVFELHGHMREATCIHCFTVYDGQSVIEKFLEDRVVPRCTTCGSVLKPNVILFGEQLPIQEFNGAKKALRHSDMMIVVGSSLEVAPASDLPMLARRNGAKLVIINLEPTALDEFADTVIRGNAAEILPSIVQSLEEMM